MLIAVPCATMIERALELTVDYTRQRPAFGGTLFDLQNTRIKLAEVATQAHITRVFVNDGIQRLVAGTLDADAAYMAKWWCTEQAVPGDRRMPAVVWRLRLHGRVPDAHACSGSARVLKIPWWFQRSHEGMDRAGTWLAEHEMTENAVEIEILGAVARLTPQPPASDELGQPGTGR